MYSYEDRIRAVELFIKLGMRVRPTIRQLGYPTKNSLARWYREYEREQDLQVKYFRTSGNYSAEQKQLAVQHYLEHDQCMASTLRALGYPLVRLAPLSTGQALGPVINQSKFHAAPPPAGPRLGQS